MTDVPVAEGQIVKAGDVLIRLDDREAKAAVVLAEGALAQADARMRQLRELTLPAAEASLTQAQATLVDAQKTFDRAATLNRNGYETRANLDDATRALEIARAQQYYREARPLLGLIQPGARASRWALIRIYSSLLDRIAEQSYDVLRRRISLGVTEKVWIVARAALGWM